MPKEPLHKMRTLSGMDSEIIAYRGTDRTEEKPGISWTLDKNTASSYPFNRGRVFKAVILKEKILIYFAHEEDEKEIIADIVSGYSIIEDLSIPTYNMLKELEPVKLLCDYNEIKAGTLGTILLVYDDHIVEVEFVDGEGDAIGVYTIPVEVLEKTES